MATKEGIFARTKYVRQKPRCRLLRFLVQAPEEGNTTLAEQLEPRVMLAPINSVGRRLRATVDAPGRIPCMHGTSAFLPDHGQGARRMTSLEGDTATSRRIALEREGTESVIAW